MWRWITSGLNHKPPLPCKSLVRRTAIVDSRKCRTRPELGRSKALLGSGQRKLIERSGPISSSHAPEGPEDGRVLARGKADIGESADPERGAGEAALGRKGHLVGCDAEGDSERIWDLVLGLGGGEINLRALGTVGNAARAEVGDVKFLGDDAGLEGGREGRAQERRQEQGGGLHCGLMRDCRVLCEVVDAGDFWPDKRISIMLLYPPRPSRVPRWRAATLVAELSIISCSEPPGQMAMLILDVTSEEKRSSIG